MSAVTTRDAEWTDRDREEMLALAEYRAGICPNGCGHPLAETTTHDDTGPAYSVHRKTCRACAARLESVRASDDGGSGDSRARIWWISRDDRR